jgi:hypothetical protein
VRVDGGLVGISITSQHLYFFFFFMSVCERSIHLQHNNLGLLGCPGPEPLVRQGAGLRLLHTGRQLVGDFFDLFCLLDGRIY